MTNDLTERWKPRLARLFAAGCLAALLVVPASFFSVPEGFAVVVTRLGKPMREVTVAGPGWRLPAPIDQVHSIDCRRQILDTPPTATLTRDKKSVVLTTYVVWHVTSPLRFLQSVGSNSTAASHLAGMITAAKNQAVSRYDLAALVSTDPAAIQINEIERLITQQVSQQADTRLGVTVDRIAFQRITLPRENVAAVLERMRAEREAEAGRVRSEGAKMAQAIRDQAHVQSQEVLRRGREAASRIAADAEREAGEVLARAQSQDPEFFRFWSALRASRQSLGSNATIVLRSDQAFFGALLEPRKGAESESPAPKSPALNAGATVPAAVPAAVPALVPRGERP